MHFEGRKQVPRSGANLVTWPLVRRNGTEFGCSVTFSRSVKFLCVVIMVDSYLWLQHADIAQQAFSAAERPTLHNALPAIEKMYSAWQKASEKPRYHIFKPALEAAMAKLDEYYKRTAESDAHIIAMGMFFKVIFLIYPNNKDLVLDPRKKFKHFAKNWDTDLQDDVKFTVQKKVPVHPLHFNITLTIPFQVY